MANAKTTAPVNAAPSREEFVREYMAQLAQTRQPKRSIVEKLAGWTEDRVISATKNSKRSYGRIKAAWEIADQIADQAYAEEHAKFAEETAIKLGLK